MVEFYEMDLVSLDQVLPLVRLDTYAESSIHERSWPFVIRQCYLEGALKFKEVQDAARALVVRGERRVGKSVFLKFLNCTQYPDMEFQILEW